MRTTSLLPALRIATRIHGVQKDKAGHPYIFHVMRVAEALPEGVPRVVGLLHDSLEDCGKNEAARIRETVLEEYGEEVLDALEAVTKRRNEAYFSYLQRVAANPAAIQVKLADLGDNLREDRLCLLDVETKMRLLARYTQAHEFLHTHL